MRSMKFTVVGDGAVGKTCLLIAYSQNTFPVDYVPTVFDNFATTIYVDNKEYAITLWDTAGQEDYATLRPLSYPNTDCFLVCYSISEKISYENIMTTWKPELEKHLKEAPIILVGTKSDMRVPNSDKFVSKDDGKKLAKKISAFAFVECSAKRKINLQKVFEEAVNAVEFKNKPDCRCIIL